MHNLWQTKGMHSLQRVTTSHPCSEYPPRTSPLLSASRSSSCDRPSSSGMESLDASALSTNSLKGESRGCRCKCTGWRKLLLALPKNLGRVTQVGHL